MNDVCFSVWLVVREDIHLRCHAGSDTATSLATQPADALSSQCERSEAKDASFTTFGMQVDGILVADGWN